MWILFFINLKRRPNIDVGDIDLYLDYIKKCFGNKRKTILNSLKINNFSQLEKFKEFLILNDYNLNIRAEQISIDEYLKI